MTKERKNDILNKMIDWLDYHDLPELVDELMDERYELDNALSDGIIFIDDHIHDIEDKLLAWQEVIGLTKEEMVELGILEMYDATEKLDLEENKSNITLDDIKNKAQKLNYETLIDERDEDGKTILIYNLKATPDKNKFDDFDNTKLYDYLASFPNIRYQLDDEDYSCLAVWLKS